MAALKLKVNTDRVFNILVATLLTAGILLRLYIYLSNRNLMVDEANIALNIFERGYLQLLLPLDYEQYAPPVFLWLLKTCSILFGYSEYSLKLYPFITGVASLLLLYKLLKKALPVYVIWYPVALLTVGFTFLRYSTELKQYMPDIMVTLLLLLVAFSADITRKKPLAFISILSLAGSLAVWSSMPSVFVLAGVGMYYVWYCVSKQKLSALPYIIIPIIIWCLQFALYYFFILQDQANSQYLQDYHKDYFIIGRPQNIAEWTRNWQLVRGLLEITGGHTVIPVFLHLSLILTGAAGLLYKRKPEFMLLVVPIVALLIASALKQYSLQNRVPLFITPVLLILIGYGMFTIIHLLRNNIARFAVYILCIISFVSFASISSQYPFKYEEVTMGLQQMKEHNIPPKHLYLYQNTYPAYQYYTTIHPDKKQWQQLQGANKLKWDCNYGALSTTIDNQLTAGQQWGIIFTASPVDENRATKQIFESRFHLQDKIELPYLNSYVYRK